MFTAASPIFYVDNTLSYLAEDLSPSSYFSSSYLHLPSPLIYNETDNYFDTLLTHHDHLPITTASASVVSDDHSSVLLKSTSTTTEKMDPNKDEETVNGIVEDGTNNNNTTTTNNNDNKKKLMRSSSTSHNGMRVKRRTSKKDRHSKIKTAQGLRDRRMRLSLEVARSFFTLQDMLGYDKASRTVEWLLIQSKSAIEELLGSSINSKYLTSPSGLTTKCTMSSNSDCEVESVIIEEENKLRKKRSSSGNSSSTITCSNAAPRPKAKPIQKRKRTPTKESREEARARARKRTLERKVMLSSSTSITTTTTSSIISTWGALEMMEGSYNDSNSQSQKGSNITPLDHQIGDHIVDSALTTCWNPLTTFGC